MTVGLGVAWSGEEEFNSPFFTEFLEVERDELRATVCDYLLGYSKAADNIFPYEVLYLSILDLVICPGLYPLGEIVCNLEHINSLVGGYKKLPYYVHPSLYEGPWKEDVAESL